MRGCPWIFGEVLFDCFPDGEQVLGGAPFNVAWHLQAFGEMPVFVSRVGTDAPGRAILEAMQDWGMCTEAMQVDASLPTGRVDVSFADGEPAYDIVHPCAYDAIAPAEVESACALIYHGSLALREASPRRALQQLKAQGDAPVFVDVNLRPPWWQPDALNVLIDGADWVKLNTAELTQLAPGCTAEEFVARHGLSGLVLTHGADGAELVVPGAESVRVSPQGDAVVIDTVGAGDAFAAVMLLGILRGWSPGMSAERAQDFASRLVGQRGATVKDRAFYEAVMAVW